MSRSGRGGGRIGSGTVGGGAFGAASLQAMGLTFADIQNMSREQAELYPPYDGLPTLTEPSEEEKKICSLQEGFAERLRASAFYLIGEDAGVKHDLPRYSDKYRPSPAARPTLKRKDLHAPFFPREIFEDYFNPKRRRGTGTGREKKKRATKKVKLDEIPGAQAGAVEGDEEQVPGADKPSPAGSASEDEDEAGGEDDDDDDVDDELGENDYVENYFDNGEGDDLDDLGDGGGGTGGDGGDYD